MKQLNVETEGAFALVPLKWLNEMADEVGQMRKTLERIEAENDYEYLTAQEIMEKYRISRRTIYTMKISGTIECIKVGKREKFKIYKGKKNIVS